MDRNKDQGKGFRRDYSQGRQMKLDMALANEPASLEAICETVIFRNEDNGYTVALFAKTGDKSPALAESFTAVGSMPFLEEGDYASLSGVWIIHNSYGMQLKVEHYTQLVPHTAEAILAYLSSGIISGIGPKLAAKIVNAFGEDSLQVMREEPVKLSRINGITVARAKQISAQMIEKSDYQELSLLLTSFGLGTSRILNIYKRYGADAVRIVKENPYRLADEVSGIGFRTADSLASHFGCDPKSPYRMSSALMYCLTQAENQGHTYLPLGVLLKDGQLLLTSTQSMGTEDGTSDIDGEILANQGGDGWSVGGLASSFDDNQSMQREGYQALILSRKALAYKIMADGSFSMVEGDCFLPDIRIALPKTFEAEVASAKLLAQRVQEILPESDEDKIRQNIQSSVARMGIELASEQEEAVMLAARSYVSIITGGPGTGKTTIIRILSEYFSSCGKKVILCAPTGRAAKRMSEAAGLPASTIHRLLEIDRAETTGASKVYFKRNEENPIEADAVIVDEVSMLDTFLFYSLLRGLHSGTQVVFVGDSNQLPSVGAGNVLSDMLSSGVIPVARLTRIFRQAALSKIVLNAHRVLNGESIQFDQSLNSDCMLINKESPQEIATAISKLCAQILPDVYGIDVLRDVSVLSPSRKGAAGVNALNPLLQSAISHHLGSGLEAHGFSFCIMDKVMQTRNNYDLAYINLDGTQGTGVFNGEIGLVQTIDIGAGSLTVELDDGRIVVYERSSLDDLEPAFAVTVHKSQGSEYPVVLLAIGPGSPMLNNRNLLYTAITRAKKRLFIVTSRRILDRMIQSHDQTKRLTSLSDFLKIYCDESI